MTDKPLSILKREAVQRGEPICEHSYETPVRKGRAHYVCSKCGKDITMELLYINMLEEEAQK